jgi:hypothetical protein
MTYGFFADKEDKLEVLDFIFTETDLRVYDKDSPYGLQICEYKAVDEISSKFDLVSGDKFALAFQLWSPRHEGEPRFRKVDLDPKRCNGHTFRYSTDGWGMIQLYFGGLKGNQLNLSHLGHFNEKGALKWEATNKINGPVSLWNWTEIQVTSRRIRHYIHGNMAVRKIGSLGVLHGADELEKQGVTLRG